ncbi:MAG: right-handed parallel beta-helix repeat-containing protein [candidate division Zixibacteria bacterium]|nr:right-handed parallel beta-helix repeat-containing protein [candidate division Zixibacteria bacterium]
MRNALFYTLSVFLAFVCFAVPTSGTIIHVTQANGRTIQDGIDLASDNDTVLVEARTWTGAGNRNITFDGKAILVLAENSETTIIDVQSQSYNGFELELSFEDNNTIIDGFTVQNSRNGVYILQSAPTIRNMTFMNNGTGVRIDTPAGTPRIRNCQFNFNDSGVISLAYTGSPCVIDSSYFLLNDYGVFGDFTLNYSTIDSGNIALGCNVDYPGYQFAANDCFITKQAVQVLEPGDQSYFTNCRIQENHNTIAYGMTLSSDYIHLTFTDCQIDNNDGGIEVIGEDVYVTMTNTRYAGNSEGVRHRGSSRGALTITNCTFTDNNARPIYVEALEPDVTVTGTLIANNEGIGVYVSYCGGDVLLQSNTIANNDFGIYLNTLDGAFTLANSIVAYCDTNGIVLSGSIAGATTITCNDVFGNGDGNYAGISDYTGINGNISANPQFCDFVSRNYRIHSASPCSPLHNTCGVLMGAREVDCDELRPLYITAYSPVNLWVTDPDGYFIGKDAYGALSQNIYPADYDEEAPEYYDIVTIYYPIPGEYLIEVIPEDGAPPGMTYSVGIRLDGSMQCIIVEDADVPADGSVDSLVYVVEEGYHYLNGDANRDDAINLLDILYIIDYLYATPAGPAPDPFGAADATCDLVVNLLDVLYLIDHLYGDPLGPPPCDLTE